MILSDLSIKRPMTRAVVGGLMTSALLPLLVVSVMYRLMDDFGDWVKRQWKNKNA